MANTTSRLGLTQPVGSDAASELRVSITNNSGILDNATLNFSGTLANRGTVVPSPVEGMRYYATDVPGEYLYDGSTWQPILIGATSQPTRTTGTGYKPNASRFTLVIATFGFPNSSPNKLTINMDSSSSPSTVIATVQGTGGTAGSAFMPVTFGVPAGKYYEFVLVSGALSTLAVTEQTL